MQILLKRHFLEKIFVNFDLMNFKKELIKNILYKGLNVFLSFGITIVMVRLLGTEGNGVYSLFITNAAIITLVVSFSFNSGLVYYSAKKNFAPATLINSSFLILLIQTVIIIIAEIIFNSAFKISLFSDIHSAEISFWGCFYLFSVLLNGYVSAIFTGNKWFDILNLLTAASNFIFLLIFGYLLLQNHGNSMAYTIFVIKIFISLTALQSVVYLIVLLKKINFTFYADILKFQELRLIFMYAGVAFFSNLFQFLAYRMDYWFVNIYRSKSELGLYALASKLNQVLWLLPMTIAAVIIPFTVASSEEIGEKVKTILRLQFSGYILMTVLLCILAPFFIPFIFGTGFSDAVYPFIILLPGVIIFTLTTILAAYFAGINRQDINLKISFFCFFTIFIGDWILVPTYGMEGAAAASCMGYTLSGISSLYVFSRLSKSNFKELLIFRKKDFSRIKSLLAGK
jgi:O-antigen/teichoic acid export membrane protein